MEYQKIKAQQKWKEKEERTDFQRFMKESLNKAEWTNYLLAFNLMVLIGIFISLVFGG